ncbi:17311_t:CDS:10 [Dentiscutata erythropus]|uniref:17311_t:CDS:1 n=1 Tax=Dentiscutata erythropus TaxID=1348616 RepID=A0A9N9HAU5_9GLOM|nr:17311_t:CDS:10 [Dentiscutata erythropus]
MWNHEPDTIENVPEPTPSEKKSVKKSPTSATTLQPMADKFSDLSVSTETTYTQNTAFNPTKSNPGYLDESKQQVEMKKEDDYWKCNESHSTQDYMTTYSHDYKKKDERQHDLIINASAPLSSSSEPFDTSPTTPQFNKRRQDSFGSSREGMASTTYPLYASPYHQYPSHNSHPQYGIYGSRASDYSSSQQSIGSSQIISTAGRISNDDEMNAQKIIKTESIDEQLSTYWTGSLVKGQLAQYIGRVIVKPLKDRCDNVDYIGTIMSQPQLWMRNMLPQPYAERLVDPKDSIKYPMFLMDFIDDGNDNTRKAIEADLLGMKWNEIVGIIWLNDSSNLCWLVFPNSQRTSTQLRIVPRPIEKFIIIPKTIYIDENTPFGYIESIKQSDPQTVAITQNPIIQDRLTDDLYYATQVSILSNNYYALPELCRNNPYFGVFGSKEKFEVREIIEAIHVNYLNQINFIPRLIELKHKQDCKFHIFGCDLYSPDPVNLVECFSSGGIVTVTPQVFLSGRYNDIIQRVMDVCNKQLIEKNWKWTIKLYSEIGTMLDAMCTEQEYKAYFTYTRFKNHMECQHFELFNDEEVKCIEKLQKQDPPMVKILYYIMTRIHNSHLTEFRHVILIQDDTEVELGVADVPGVERMLLTDFESIFGCSESV